jgi:hypothetical protein
MDNWKKKGASPEKLIVGFPAYGHTFILSDSTKTEIGAPSNRGGHPGPHTKQTGFWAYYEVSSCLYMLYKFHVPKKKNVLTLSVHSVFFLYTE